MAGLFIFLTFAMRVSAAGVSLPPLMSASNIPADVRRFLLAAIESVPHLEALLLLRADPESRWTPESLALRLYIDEAAAARLLADLRQHGLVREESPGTWSFRVANAGMGEVVDRLAQVYARHVVEVAELIHSTSDRKAQRFADAFHWRKDKET